MEVARGLSSSLTMEERMGVVVVTTVLVGACDRNRRATTTACSSNKKQLHNCRQLFLPHRWDRHQWAFHHRTNKRSRKPAKKYFK
ncbi:hypothetical protein GLYMA_07G042200v4 [Glycine max]|uniref:Uncharacterized protein n=1 Tax=Glycine max TaxID=3847 RepID=K7KZK9_SOYBN|nr:hypothetical protein JHK87_017450 [Glycine soja]KAG5021603.1 hypothetical protein JHK85_017945 [Glycine max]KAH1085336.1 hypothetical protein GYH30_017362 [Glycine max]KRH47649.1 hypothetical protein GLYMA_07G042200v4 [Glycine max]